MGRATRLFQGQTDVENLRLLPISKATGNGPGFYYDVEDGLMIDMGLGQGFQKFSDVAGGGGGSVPYGMEVTVAPTLEEGDYTNLSDAFAAGYTKLYVKNGSYVERPTDWWYYADGITKKDINIIGESKNGVDVTIYVTDEMANEALVDYDMGMYPLYSSINFGIGNVLTIEYSLSTGYHTFTWLTPPAPINEQSNVSPGSIIDLLGYLFDIVSADSSSITAQAFNGYNFPDATFGTSTVAMMIEDHTNNTVGGIFMKNIIFKAGRNANWGYFIGTPYKSFYDYYVFEECQFLNDDGTTTGIDFMGWEKVRTRGDNARSVARNCTFSENYQHYTTLQFYDNCRIIGTQGNGGKFYDFLPGTIFQNCNFDTIDINRGATGGAQLANPMFGPVNTSGVTAISLINCRGAKLRINSLYLDETHVNKIGCQFGSIDVY